MQSVKAESSKSLELERLRRELLQRIVESENRRQATRLTLAK